MNRVIEYLRSNQNRFIDELCEFLRFRSVSTQSTSRPELLACVEWLAAHCRSIGLATRLVSTEGNPVLLASTPRRLGRRHFVVYGHYDVQPPDPLDQWQTNPFEPSVREGFISARGASDNKGPLFAHLKAVEGYLKTATELPCDLTFFIEGEEEIGSHSLPAFVAAYRGELSCDAFVVSDTTIPALDLPGITCSLRGLVSAEVKVSGPNRDLHSGLHGGVVENPAFALCQLLARCRDNQGTVTIPGFNEHILTLSSEEAADLEHIPVDQLAYCQAIGVDSLINQGKPGIKIRSTAQPTFEINGLSSGYEGEGIKTIIPSTATAKVSMRLIADQEPNAVFRSFESYLQNLCPHGIRLSVSSGFLAEPYAIDPTNCFFIAALRVLRLVFERAPIRLREGVSIPIVALVKHELQVESLLLGLSLPDDRWHSPNERFSLELFRRGQE